MALKQIRREYAHQEEYRAKYAFDRMETTGTMWLGLTMTCARCHTHKYDPITQREYYSFSAFFNQTEDTVLHAAPCDVLAVRWNRK